MKINFAVEYKNRKGEVVQAESGPCTLAYIAVSALDAGASPGEPLLPAYDKRRYAKLADKVFEAGELDLEERDFVLLRQRIGKMINSPPVATWAIEQLDLAKGDLSEEAQDAIKNEGV